MVRCPRCTGSLYAGEDGPTCFACGYVDVAVPEFVRQEVEKQQRGERKRRRGPSRNGARI